jgi:TolB-like protein
MASGETNHEVTLAIFPFENLSENNNADLYCRSFNMDLVSNLSRFRQFRVLSQESLILAGDKTPFSDFHIKGSFQCAGDSLRINAQLIDLQNNRVVWADRFHGEKESVLAMQQEILEKVTASLQQQLNYSLLTHIRRKPPTQFSAYENWLYGIEELKKGTVEADEKARSFFLKAIETDPLFSLAYSGMSLTYFNEWSCQLWDRWEASRDGAFEWAKKAIDIDPHNHIAALVLGRVYLYHGEYEISEHYLRRALRLNPNDTESLVQVASCLVFHGYIKEAESLYLKVKELDPLNEAAYNHIGALIAFELGDFKKALTLGMASVASWVDFHAFIAAIYHRLGDQPSTELHWQKFLDSFCRRISSEFTKHDLFEWARQVNPFRWQGSNYEAFLEFKTGVSVPLPAEDSSARSRGSVCSFFRKNDVWEITFAGNVIQLADLKGLHDLARFLSRPEHKYHCSELFGLPVSHESVFVFDEKAKRSYQSRLNDMQEEIQWLAENNDFERAATLRKEYDELLEHLSAGLGLGGKTRKAEDPVEKARAAVTWRIRKAIKKIDAENPVLGKHLKASIKTGVFCGYDPEYPTSWEVSF